MTPDRLEEFFYDPAEEAVELPTPELAPGAALLAPVSDEIEELLAFRAGGDDYAFEIGSIHEIVRPPPLTGVPRMPRAVLGVISLRGEALPVFDPLRLLGLAEKKARTPSGARRVIVLRTEAGLAGLDVDAVEQVVRLPRRDIEAPPRSLAGQAGAVALKGIGRWSGRLLAILDPEELLAAERRR